MKSIDKIITFNQIFKLLPNLVVCLSSIATPLYSSHARRQPNAMPFSDLTILASDLTLNRERRS